MMAAFDDRPKPPGEPGPYADAALAAWTASITNGTAAVGEAEAPKHRSAAELQNPCTGCAAYCCTTLVFPQAVPAHISNLDYFRFCLGFPGVELGVGDGVWSIIIRTTCRHLKDNRCTVYGQPERPLICKYYDEWKCDYKRQFGEVRPADMLRLRLEQWEWLASSFLYDDNGAIVEMPPMEAIRQLVEAQWRARGDIELIPLMVKA
jgi:Fe-S-cluster containining protein